jgi:hypothetical protein
MPLGRLQHEADLKRQIARWASEPSFRMLFADKNPTEPAVFDLDLGFANLRGDYDAVGDGNVSAGTGTDDLAALNAAISDLNDGTIDALYIPSGCYILSGVPDVITASDYYIFGDGPSTILRMQDTAAHGKFFTLGESAGQASARGRIADMTVWCNPTTNTPPADERAFHLINGGTTFITNIFVFNIGGLCKIGSNIPGDRFQLYGFHEIYGTWNSHTPSPSRIHIINGTDGRFVDIRLTENEVNGGYGVHGDPTSAGIDQHFFHNCEIWAMGAHSENLAAGDTYDGIDWNVYLNFTDGQIVNWTFHQCVLDEGRNGAVRIFSTAGNSTCRDMHFVDCHYATNAGRGFFIDHAGTGILSSLQIIGGRIRYKDAPAVQLDGSAIASAGLSNVDLLHESVAYSSANTTRDSIVHGHKHGRAVDDEIIFTGSPPAPLVAGTSYYVKNVDANGDDKEFTLSATTPASGGATINLTASASGAYFIAVDAAFQQNDADGVRVNGCYFGPFQGATSATDVACKNLGASVSDFYSIVGNVSRAMVTGFDTGYGASASEVVASNAAG